MTAAHYGNKESVDCLLEAGANPRYHKDMYVREIFCFSSDLYLCMFYCYKLKLDLYEVMFVHYRYFFILVVLFDMYKRFFS